MTKDGKKGLFTILGLVGGVSLICGVSSHIANQDPAVQAKEAAEKAQRLHAIGVNRCRTDFKNKFESDPLGVVVTVDYWQGKLQECLRRVDKIHPLPSTHSVQTAEVVTPALPDTSVQTAVPALPHPAGETKDDIKKLQAYLNSQNYHVGSVDGIKGPKYYKAVTRILKDRGFVDPEGTAKTLDASQILFHLGV